MNHHIRSLLLILPISIMVSNCSPQEDAGSSLGDADLTVRVYRSQQDILINPYKVVNSHVFGTDQGSETYLFTAIRVIGVCPHEHVHIYDWREGTIHRFLKDGTHIKSFGGQGGGPGEFDGDFAAMLFDEELLTWDDGLLRMQRFTCEGEYLGQVRIPPGYARYFAPYTNLDGQREYMGFGRFTAVQAASSSSEITLSSHLQFSTFREDLKPISTVLDSALSRTYPRFGRRPAYPPFEMRWPRFALSGGNPLAWTWAQEYIIRLYDPVTGGHSAISIPDHQPRVLSPEIRQWQMEAWQLAFPIDEEYARRIRATEWPSTLPHISQMLWDATGRLWVGEYAIPGLDEGPFAFNVFNANGEWLFTQHLPVLPHYIAEDGIYVTDFNGSGDPIVRFYKFIPSPNAG
ncbi:hypothetical protein ACFL6T_00990 [Candidatus Zixiibacteriota bacterium]